MKAAKMLLGVALVLTMAVVVRAEKDDKVVTLKGTFACAKCVLKVDGIKKCTNAITVKDGDKETIYLLDDEGGKAKYHKAICTDSKKGSVKGTVSKKGDQMWIKPVEDGVMMED